jgi:anti-anti-sigma factor
MQVRWSEAHKVAVIDPQGDLGIRTMVEIKNTVGTLLRDGCRTLIVDCRGVQRVEAIGLGVLVERLCRARDLGGTLALANLSPELTGWMRELRVDSLFQAFESVQAALDVLVGIHSDAAAVLAA